MIAQQRPERTVATMEDRQPQGRLLPTPFVASFVGRARPGDVYDTDPARRAAAWAHWAVSALTEMTGLSDRTYAALTLTGRFYDPKGTGPTVRPHLEIPRARLDEADPEFPDRLALAGNGLNFPWWVYHEVTAVRRMLFNTGSASIEPLIELLGERRAQLQTALVGLMEAAAPSWRVIEGLLVSSPDGLSAEAAGDFSEEEVAEFFPGAEGLHLRVVYDPKLRTASGQWASRRVGVWQVRGVDQHGHRLAIGVITPRLTANSLFADRMFAPEREGAGALLVRGLLLRRLVQSHLEPLGLHQVRTADVGADRSRPGGPYLRSVVARVGAKLPRASMEAAVHFLQTYQRPDAAWEALTSWAERTKSLLTVSEEGFKECHRNALRFIRRAEEPSRDDVDCILPLAWDSQQRVVRVTFSRPVEPNEE